MQAKNADITCVFGRRGSGKTTCVKALTRADTRIVFFDPQDEYSAPEAAMKWPGARKLDGAGDLKAALKKARAKSVKMRLAYVPPMYTEKDHLDALCRLLLAYQQPYMDGDDTREITLVVDELDVSYGQSLRAGESAFERVVRQGRHYGIKVIGASQFPTQVRPDFRRNARSTYTFALSDASAVQNVSQFLGRQHVDAVRALKNHEAILYRDGEITEYRNPPIKK